MVYELCCRFHLLSIGSLERKRHSWANTEAIEGSCEWMESRRSFFRVNGSGRSFSCEWIWSRLFWAFCLFPTWAAELSCGGQRPVQATNTKLYKSTNKHSKNTQINIYKNTQILGWPRKYRGWGHVWTTKENWCSQFLESSTTYHQQIIM